MPTNFKPLLSVKKSQMDKQEQKILRQNAKIAQKQDEIHQILTQISQLEFPQNGASYSVYLSILEHKNSLIAIMDALNAELSNLKSEKEQQEQLYKYLQIEYEKFKYLDTKQTEQHIKAIKKAQENEIDEIALMLYKRERL